MRNAFALFVPCLTAATSHRVESNGIGMWSVVTDEGGKYIDGDGELTYDEYLVCSTVTALAIKLSIKWVAEGLYRGHKIKQNPLASKGYMPCWQPMDIALCWLVPIGWKTATSKKTMSVGGGEFGSWMKTNSSKQIDMERVTGSQWYEVILHRKLEWSL